MAAAGWNCRQWSAKRWVFVSISIILALIPIIIAIPVILRPRTILLYISKAWLSSAIENGKTLNLIVTANNTDHIARVEYISVVADLLYESYPVTYSVPADVSMTSVPLRQPPRCTTEMNVSAVFMEKVWSHRFVGGKKKTNIMVQITTEVKFIVGGLYSRPYTVSVSCNPTPFFDLNTTSVLINCTG